MPESSIADRKAWKNKLSSHSYVQSKESPSSIAKESSVRKGLNEVKWGVEMNLVEILDPTQSRHLMDKQKASSQSGFKGYMAIFKEIDEAYA